MSEQSKGSSVFSSRLFWGPVLFLLALDQASKEMSSKIAGAQVLPGLEIAPTSNYAGALGVYDLPHPALFLLVPALLFVPFFFFYHRGMSSAMIVAVALFVAGVLGNGLDRIYRGSVIDWLEVSSEVVFNLADVFVLFGLVSLFLCIVRSYKRQTAGARDL